MSQIGWRNDKADEANSPGASHPLTGSGAWEQANELETNRHMDLYKNINRAS